MKRLQVVSFAMLVGAANLALATRPLTVDDADPTGVGQCQLTAGTGWEKRGAYRDWDFPVGAAYGLVTNLEINAAFGAQRGAIDRDEDDPAVGFKHKPGWDDLTIGAKWQFFGETVWLPRQALEPSVTLPTASHAKGLGSGRPDYDLTWAASKALNSKLQVDLNFGYTWLGEPSDERDTGALHGGAALEYALTDHLQWVGELFGERELQGDGETTVQDNTGLRWQVAEGLTLDAAIGSRLRGDAPHLSLTFGLSWVFGVI